MNASPIVVAGVAAVCLVALVLGYKLVTNLAASRAKLTLDERNRQDAAAKAAAGDPTLNTFGQVLDPLGLFH